MGNIECQSNLLTKQKSRIQNLRPRILLAGWLFVFLSGTSVRFCFLCFRYFTQDNSWKLAVTSATLLVTSALLVVTRS